MERQKGAGGSTSGQCRSLRGYVHLLYLPLPREAPVAVDSAVGALPTTVAFLKTMADDGPTASVSSAPPARNRSNAANR